MHRFSLPCRCLGQFYCYRRVRYISLVSEVLRELTRCISQTFSLAGPRAEFNTTSEIINLTVTCFVIGFGIGPLFFAPLSEVVGRKPIYCISIFFYFIFTLPAALAKNAATLVVSRQIAGLAASAPMCNVGGRYATSF